MFLKNHKKRSLKFFGDKSEGPSTSLWNFDTLDNKHTKKKKDDNNENKKKNQHYLHWVGVRHIKLRWWWCETEKQNEKTKKKKKGKEEVPLVWLVGK